MKKKKNKKKKKTPSPGEKGYIDWVNKKNKVPNYVSRGGEADTKNGGDDTSPTSVGQLMGGIVVFAILGFILFSIFNAIDKADPIDKAKEFFDDRSDKKEYCAERAEDASNSYAAKKIYKACMSNY